MLNFILKIFKNPEKEALKLLAKQRDAIAAAGGSQKLLTDLLDGYQNNSVQTTLNLMGLNFETEPPKSVLKLAVLDLLYEARFQNMQNQIRESLIKHSKSEASAESTAENLMNISSGKEYQETEQFKLAKLMNGIIARMVSLDEGIVAEEKNPILDSINTNVSSFDLAVREASAEILINLTSVAGTSFHDQVNRYKKAVQGLSSENINYWDSLASEREMQDAEAFSKWEEADLNLLKKLVKGD